MLLVRIDLIHSMTGKVSRIGTALIANDGTGTEEVGNYQAIFEDKGRLGSPRFYSSLDGFRRLDNCSWDLLSGLLDAEVENFHSSSIWKRLEEHLDSPRIKDLG